MLSTGTHTLSVTFTPSDTTDYKSATATVQIVVNPTLPAAMSTPAPSSTLTGSSATFTWTAGTQVTQYTLHVGTTGVGSTNISTPGALNTLTYTVSNIPTTGGTLYVRLYSLIAGAWQYHDYTYTEAP